MGAKVIHAVNRTKIKRDKLALLQCGHELAAGLFNWILKMSDFQEYITSVLKTATKLKKVMQNKNLTAARAKCPHCDKGFVHGRLHPPKYHLWMKCDHCSVFMME